MSVDTHEPLVVDLVQANALDGGGLDQNGFARRTTAEALEIITLSETRKLSHEAWYEPERDFW